MPTIKVNKVFTMSLNQVKLNLDRLAQELESEYGMQYQWQDNYYGHFSYKTAKGLISITDNEVTIELKLGIMYSAMAPAIKSRIIAMADQYIS